MDVSSPLLGWEIIADSEVGKVQQCIYIVTCTVRLRESSHLGLLQLPWSERISVYLFAIILNPEICTQWILAIMFFLSEVCFNIKNSFFGNLKGGLTSKVVLKMYLHKGDLETLEATVQKKNTLERTQN